LLYGAIFVGSILLVEGVYFLISDRLAPRRAVNRRMRMLSADADRREVLKKFRRDQDPVAAGIGIGAQLAKMIVQSGLTISVGRLASIMAALGVVSFTLVYLFGVRSTFLTTFASPLALAGIFAIVIGIAGPLVYLQYLTRSRRRTFTEQLPDALDMMVRSLKVGHPVNVSMETVASQMSDPLGTEFGIAVDEVSYGMDFNDALRNLEQRVPVPDFQYVTIAVGIQHETGGNLAETLESLASVIRARFRMFKRVKALSAEARFSAKILGVLPIAFAGLTFAGKPEFYLNVIEDPLFLRVIAIGAVLQLIGVFIMYRMVNFRV
jgi:tight adherence protein B